MDQGCTQTTLPSVCHDNEAYCRLNVLYLHTPVAEPNGSHVQCRGGLNARYRCAPGVEVLKGMHPPGDRCEHEARKKDKVEA